MTTWNILTSGGGTVVTEDEDGALLGDASFTGFENLVGSAGEDIFVFGDGINFDGTIDGGTGGKNTLDYSACSSSNFVEADLSAGTATGTAGISRIQNVIGGSGNDILTGNDEDNILSGGPGDDIVSGRAGHNTLSGGEGNDTLSDTLIGNPEMTTWTILSPGGGTVITEDEDGAVLADVTFTGFENLFGSVRDDTFVFADGMGVAGTIDGGEGANTLDYSLYSAANSVTVDLGNGETTGAASFSNVRIIKGGSGEADTLVGPKEDSTWNITGSNSGDVNGIIFFSGFENLTGSPDNVDEFIFLCGGHGRQRERRNFRRDRRV